MVELIARIEFYNSKIGRKLPFGSGYRPLFDFNNADTTISGKIDLINQDEFAPGEIGAVKITFV